MNNTVEYSSIEPLKDKFLRSKFHIIDAYDMKEIAEILEYIAMQGSTGQPLSWNDVMDNFMRNLFEQWSIQHVEGEITSLPPDELNSTLDKIHDLSLENIALKAQQSLLSSDSRTNHE